MNNADNTQMNADGSKPGLPGIFKNKIVLIGGGLILVLLIVAIIVNAGNGKKKVATEDKNLTVWGLNDPSVYTDIIADFQTANSGYKVTYVKKDSASYEADALSEIAAGKGPDVWAVSNNWIPKFQDKLIPMTDNLIADKKAKKNDIETYADLFPKVAVQDNIIDNKIYGMPLYIDTLVLFYNRSLINKSMSDYITANPKADTEAIGQIFSQGPKNWDEFVQMTKLITKKDGNTITQSAIPLGTSSNINQATDILALLMMQDGAKMTADDFTSAQFQTKQNVFGGQEFPGAQALNFYTAFANPSNDLYSWNSSIEDSLHAFANGKTAMTFDYASAKTDINRINANLEVNYFAMPQVKETKNPVNYASYMTLTVTKAAKNSALAWQFINATANSSKTSNYVTKMGKQPAQLILVNDNISEITAKQVLTAQDWHNPDPTKTKTIFADTIQQANDGKNIQTAIEYASTQITALLAKLK